MAAYNKHHDYVEQLNKGVHDWSTHDIKAVLCNTAPVATNSVLADLTQISTGNGYTAGAGGGLTLDNETLSETTGTAKVVIDDEVFTAAGGSVGPLRYIDIYNNTPTSPADPLVCFFDYGSAITLLDTETLTLDFDPTNGLWQLA